MLSSYRSESLSLPLFCVSIILLFLAGCGGEAGPPRVDLSGRVTSAGEPLVVQGADVGLGMVAVEFYPLDERDAVAAEPLETTTVQPSGEFHLVDGIPPGRYRIAVRQWDPYPNVDRLQGRFSPQNTRIIRDLTLETKTLEIDVSQPEG